MTVSAPPRETARARLLDAALAIIRRQGFAATSVDDLCRAAGVTKGAFFHHFRSKGDLAVAAAARFGELADRLFTAEWTHEPDPAARVLGYVALRRAMIAGPFEDFTCLLGTMVQESYATSPAIRAACGAGITGHASRLVPDIGQALAAAGRDPAGAEGLALHIQAALQGGFILAKATGDPETARATIDHLETYLRGQFLSEH